MSALLRGHRSVSSLLNHTRLLQTVVRVYKLCLLTYLLAYCRKGYYEVDILAVRLLLARLIGQYCFARWRLSSSSVVYNAAGGRAGRPLGVWAVGRPTLHGGPVRIRPFRDVTFLHLVAFATVRNGLG